MRKIQLFVLAAVFLLPLSGVAELQNVEVGGSIEISGVWYTEFFEPTGAGVRYGPTSLWGRGIGPGGAVSAIRTDGSGNNLGFFEQRTRLNFKADFTDNVSAFIQLESIDIWGEDFRSNYVTGADMRASSVDDLEVYEAYIDVCEMFGTPLCLRIGRQEMLFGSGWLVGTNPDSDPFTSLSFDAVRLTYSGSSFIVDGWWSKLAENSPMEEDGDVDFYGIYLSCIALEGIEFDAYWLYVRDARSVKGTSLGLASEALERLFGVDQYGVTELHTVGLRLGGSHMGLDWDVNVAYQFGDADAVGVQFAGLTFGDDSADFDSWGVDVELGYTFDIKSQLRLYIGAEYYEGEDNRDITFLEWLNPFYTPQASVSFNRLFSDHETDAFLDGSALSNFWMFSAGVSAAPTESIEVGLDIVYQEVLEPFDSPWSLNLGRFNFPILPGVSFLTTEEDDDLGWQVGLWASYAYSEDLTFDLGWTHYFVGDALSGGAFVDENGLTYLGGGGGDDADYISFSATIEFGGTGEDRLPRHKIK